MVRRKQVWSISLGDVSAHGKLRAAMPDYESAQEKKVEAFREWLVARIDHLDRFQITPGVDRTMVAVTYGSGVADESLRAAVKRQWPGVEYETYAGPLRDVFILADVSPDLVWRVRARGGRAFVIVVCFFVGGVGLYILSNNNPER